MGESPDTGRRDGAAERSATEDTASDRTAAPEDGAGPEAARPEADGPETGEPGDRTDADPAEDTAGDGGRDTDVDGAEAEDDEDGGLDEDAAAAVQGPAGSTVHLRVRTTDHATTALRLPVDNATTALRLPPEVRKPAASESKADDAKAVDAKADDAKVVDAKADRPSAAESPAGAASPVEAETETETADKAAPAVEAAAEPPSDATTMLRVPAEVLRKASGATASGAAASRAATPEPSVSDATTMLRLPAEATKAAPAKATPSETPSAKAAPAEAPSAKAEPAKAAPAEEKPAKAEDDKAGKDAPVAADGPAEAADGAPVDNATKALRLPVDNATRALRLPPEARTPAAPAASPAEGADKAPAKPAGADPRLAMRDSREVAGAALKDTRKPVGGSVPEPLPEPSPAPEPHPEPEPGPEPEPRPAPRPQPVPTPPAPLPVPDPSPVPPPAPLPENTIEAMEVLATLSARPASPVRRAAKRTAIWTLFLAFVLGIVVVVQLLRPLPDPETKLGLPASFTFQGEQLAVDWPAKGQSAAAVIGVGPVGTSGEQKPVSIASVTKVMNAYLILKSHPLKKGESGPNIVVDKAAAQESTDKDQSRAQLVEGKELSLYQALELLMLPSANNVARLLARWDAGSEEAFVAKMNAEATRLGMADTTYADPAGYDDDTKSTAADQLKLAEQAMQDEVFRQIVAEPEMRHNGVRIPNTNDLVFTERGSVIGVKTGSSTAAQSALMWAAVKEVGGTKRTIIGVTLRQPAVAGVDLAKVAQAPSLKIIKSVQKGLNGQTLAKQGQVVGQVEDGLGGTVPIVAAKDLTVAGWSGITATLDLDAIKLGHTVKAGTQVGTLSAGEGAGRIEVPVTLERDLAPPSILSRLTRIL
ncbi:hypothetical protein [Kitasatospora sp. NPDC051914]|uniref:D-alanyl-D-alanine carboxypeptidase n=1 Tax=Kitasatospora sp. NPDC051914 TaxID=3154945 RepID=UPI00341AAEEB